MKIYRKSVFVGTWYQVERIVYNSPFSKCWRYIITNKI